MMLTAQTLRKSPSDPAAEAPQGPPFQEPHQMRSTCLDSPAEPAPAVLGPPSQGDSRVSSPSWEDGTTLQPPPAKPLLLPHRPLRPGPRLTPMVGPVPHPTAEDLTTTYTQKAKQPKLQRAESLQERSVKEAKTKCGTIASLLSAAPNLHSKGVLMFKKRRQRDKKYPLVSFGAAARTSAEEEDGLPPTSESELYEEAFSYARSLTNQSDWDSPYLDTELPGRAQAQQRAGGWEGSGVRPPGEGPTLNSSASAQPPSPSSWPGKVQRPRSMDRACSLHLSHKALRQRRLCSHSAPVASPQTFPRWLWNLYLSSKHL